ncbi:hypothetical protein Tco_0680441 [Tanacetum coccineum]|uniref:Uncharacterized protein n=1 Tax=Tanacetum coccineum TaxID=301880 RepID=A0ABQ4XM46_9ASTR
MTSILLKKWKLLKKPKSQLSIRGVFVDGERITDPLNVKHAFFSQFANRFDKSHEYRVQIDSQFPNILSMDQVEELEREVTYDEVKKAVWEYRENKSPVLMVTHLSSVVGGITWMIFSINLVLAINGVYGLKAVFLPLWGQFSSMGVFHQNFMFSKD